uniref:Cobalt transporter subunit CbtB n=1 Tax=Candidatus Kentrum sp. MB TaxID=2138164 RepID=A0A451B731_9GAMM|nr:MAG: cobalt transporter subunit CbtB [Candidatus Kentron sp. MB]VFK28777.1 MAG: cobalt transporter subunit CbtB [Candidatus Kentron sp. MB]VFK74091.1 MAG: cobalt transporter subunit CbtB [Candidatus Kentron sp. MB]
MYTNVAVTAPVETPVADVNVRLVPALSAAILGAVLIFASGFAQTAGFTEANVLHSAAHDARHSAGFPCH